MVGREMFNDLKVLRSSGRQSAGSRFGIWVSGFVWNLVPIAIGMGFGIYIRLLSHDDDFPDK